MYFELLSKLRTTEEVSILCWELDELEKSLFMTAKGGWEETMGSRVRLEIAEILKSQLPQDMEMRRKTMRDLKEEVLSLPVVRLTLAIDPTEEMVEEMSEMLRKYCEPSVVIDILRDSLIVGGTLVTYNGKFADFSLATKFNQVWKDNSENFLGIVYGKNN